MIRHPKSVREDYPGDPGCKHCRGAGCCACLSPLPEGLTCATGCANFKRCNLMFGQTGPETCCQWIPTRFYPVEVKP